MDIQEFKRSFVRIDFQEKLNNYGHYPFQMFVERNDGKIEMAALAMAGTSQDNYRVVKNKIKEGVLKLFVSLDFPKGGDLENDFICIIKVENNCSDAIAIVYNPDNGEEVRTVDKSETLSRIKTEFDDFCGIPLEKAT